MLPSKKLAMIVLCLFILCSATVAGAVELSDIDGHWAENDIRELVGIGAITGYLDGTYRPEGTITRAEFSSVLRGALGLEEAAGATFPDTAGHWGQGRIEALVQEGVIDTDLYGSYYRPDGSITREEIAMMTVRMLGEMTGATEIPFIDADTVGEGFHPYVAEAYAQEIIFGYLDDTFRPRGTATRAEAAVMAIRALRILGMTGEEAPTIVSFSSDQDSLIAGATATLSWEVSGATAIAIDQNIGTVPPHGSVEVSPAATTTYTLTAINNAGSSTAQATIEVIPIGGILPPNGFTLLPPSITSFSADKEILPEGEAATLSWEVSGVAAVTIEPGIGEVNTSGSYSVSPAETTTYTLTASNVSGSVRETIKINLARNVVIQPGPGESMEIWVSSSPTGKDKNMGVHRLNYLPVGRSNDVVNRAPLQFDVSTVPYNAVVISAHLSMYQFNTYSGEEFLVSAHQIASAWDHTTVTWNNQPYFSQLSESTEPVTPGVTQWVSWDIKGLVQGWVGESIPNYGLVLKKANELENTTNKAQFRSTSYKDNPGAWPRLDITYYVP